MKMKMLLASGLCFALTFQLFAQETKLQDSVYITPFAGCKIVMVGKSINKLLQENSLEILKNKFIEDYRESAKDKDFPAGAKNIIYLASQDGRRRLKAVPDEDVLLNIENEIKAFKNNLPPFHYTIYDLTKKFEYHIYVMEPRELEKLMQVNCQTLLTGSTAGKATPLNKYTSIEISNSDTGFTIKKSHRKYSTDALSLSGFSGAGLINSSLSPTIGLDVEFIKYNKYMKTDFKFGSNYSFNVLADYQNKSFTNFYKFHSLDLHFLKNTSHKEDFLLGISLGKYYTDKIFGPARNGTLDKAWKFGIINQFKYFGIEYNFIYDKNKNRNAGITLRYYF